MRFAIFRGQTLHAVIESEPGKLDPKIYAETLRVFNAADSCIPIESEEHLAILRANAATADAIAAGFEFRGQRISLSERSQITISNAYTIRDSLPYPLDWANADDSGFVTLTSAADMAALQKAMALAVLVARQAGNASKKEAIG